MISVGAHDVLQKLIQKLIRSGKKEFAFFTVMQTIVILKSILKKDRKNVFSLMDSAVHRIKPLFNMRRVKRSSKSFYLPYSITDSKKLNLAVQWLVQSVTLRKERILYDRLSSEILDCGRNIGLTMEKKQSFYNIASLNRSFLYILKRKKLKK